jgi:uncharacterized DUF497 family protein
VSDTVLGSFEWDDEKAEANMEKHGVSFAEATTVFEDPNAVLLDDGSGTKKFLLIGFSAAARILTVVHVERGDRDRIISAWRATAAEERLYREG